MFLYVLIKQVTIFEFFKKLPKLYACDINLLSQGTHFFTSDINCSLGIIYPDKIFKVKKTESRLISLQTKNGL